MVEEREAAKAEAAALRAELAAAKTAATERDTLRTELAALKTTHETAGKTWGNERTLLEAGLLDADAREVATLLYGKLPIEDRPPLKAWLDGIKADPTKAPKPLAPYFGAPTPVSEPARTPAVPRPVTTSTSAGEPITREAYLAASARARTEGTKEARDAYNQVRERYLAQGS